MSRHNEITTDEGLEVTLGIDQLETFLTADDPDVREYAAGTLAEEASDRPADVRSAVASLTDCLEDEPSIRAHAAAALSAVASDYPAAMRDSVPALLEWLDGSPAVRTDIADALASIAVDDPAAIVDAATDVDRKSVV